MIDVEETEDGLHAADAEKNELPIEAADWQSGGPSRRIDRHVDATITGRATRLRFPEAAVCIDSADRDRWRTFGSGIGPLHLPHGDHVVQIETTVAAYLCFEGEASIRRTSEGGDVVVSFPESTPLTIGFRSRTRRPTERVALPPTTDGLAAAISRLAGALATTTPDRSYPSLRAHPPLLEVDPDVDVPETDAVETTGIEFRVPDRFESLFVAAPLAYYLQASVVTADCRTARLEAPEVGLVHEFEPSPEFQHQVAEVLRRVFSLDCLVREAGPYRTDLAEASLLDDVGTDPERAYAASPQERLELYLEAPFDAIDPALPDWHLSTYVDPVIDHVPALPHLLDRLSLIYRPRAISLDRSDLVKRSLADAYRSTADGQDDEPASVVDPLLPDLRRGRIHGWMADGVPIDVFKTLPEAYGNRLDYLDRNGGTKTVVVVLNEETMDDEQSAVADIYRQRAAELSIDVEIKRQLDRAELAAVFERGADFVHYIGHCDDTGLRCIDGNLSIDDIEESAAQTFFLNACHSYGEGIELISKGSVAGAVTLNTVLDDQASRVGTTFARLIVHGYSIERALRLARRRAIMNKEYIVVGDGTHTLSQGDDCHQPTIQLESKSPHYFNITSKILSPRNPGGCYQTYMTKDITRLFGASISNTISKSKLLKVLSESRAPVIYNGEYYWSTELLNELS